MMLAHILEAELAGARSEVACKQVNLSVRTVQRWRKSLTGEDQRRGPKTRPERSLSDAERQNIVDIATSPAYRDMSPKQIVPALADKGTYVASESTFYRVLRSHAMNAHRGRQKPPTPRVVTEHVATGPNQVWSWDITYLRSPTRGVFFYLYLVVDVWSRKTVAAEVFEEESGEHASAMIRAALQREGATPTTLVLHQDNGGPMKGATLKATLEALGVLPSYSRPRVSNDNPYSESLFRTLKYRPDYPRQPFASLAAAQGWVGDFVRWYNTEHRHSAIAYVSPCQRHHGTAEATLTARRAVYALARARTPQRWHGNARAWKAPAVVYLNPSKQTKEGRFFEVRAA